MSPKYRMAAVWLAGAACGLPTMAAPCSAHMAVPSIDTSAPLTLDRVLANVRRASPAVLAASLETRARRAEAEQAGRWTNPALSLEVENFAGSGGFSGFDSTEATLAIEQTLRLGNKRQLEQRAARARQALGAAECEVMLREAELDAALVYAGLLAAIEASELTGEAAELGAELTDISRKRVEAGEAAPPDLARARAEAAKLKADAAGANALVEQTRLSLAAIWGGDGAGMRAPEAFSALESSGAGAAGLNHPRLDAARATETLGESLAAFEDAQAIPDINVSAGVKRFEATGDSAMVAGVSLPLPIFNRNRNGAAAARYRTDAARAEARGVEARLRAEQQSAVSRLKAADARLALLRDEALPAASQAYDAALQGYRVGRFGLDETINARAALIDTRLALISAELERNRANLTLRSLIGAAPFEGGK